MKEKVLIVDDEPEFLEALAERMGNRGLEVQTSTSAKDALNKVESEEFDAVLLDLKMPGIDGLSALKLIKEKKPEMQVILLTGHATLQKGIEAMKLGATDFLEKPADIDTLTEKIQKAHARKIIVVAKKTEEKIREIMAEKPW
jgi:DNA-binding NtrC family response regulator